MKTFEKKFKKLYLSLGIVLIILASLGSYAFALNATSIAKEITPNAGVVSSSWEGNSKKVIIIFEENHISRVGQIEIALMLTRLYNHYHIRTIALEGAFAKKGALDNNWFYNLSDGNVREEVALQLLREGEINGAEFIALAIPKVKVIGIEKEDEYTFEISSLDENSALVYLFAIAEKLFPKDNDKIARANKLAEAMEKASDKDKPAKSKEYMDYVINANQWTKERYKNLMNKDKIISTEELLNSLKEIREKAEKVHADIGQYKDNFNRLYEFYERASKRTETMIDNTLKLSGKEQGILIPMIIGAAHTAKAAEILKKNGISYAVIRPIALFKGKDSGDLTIDAFGRKRKKLSVDDKGLIGPLLDGRWKPSPVVDQIWLRSKSELYYITTLIAHAATGGDMPPFKSLNNELSQLRYIKIDPNSLRVLDGEVIFKVTAQTNNPQKEETFWGRTVMIPYNKKKSLEERLQEILAETKTKEVIEKEKEKLKIVKVSRDTIAAFSKNLSVINKVKLSG